MSIAHEETILIVDFGSQVTQLIARRVREAGVYSEIAPFNSAEEAFHRLKPKGIILSGSPAGVPEEGSPRAPDVIFESGLPILGICYGQQVMTHQLGGRVESGDGGQFGGELGYARIKRTAIDDRALVGNGIHGNRRYRRKVKVRWRLPLRPWLRPDRICAS